MDVALFPRVESYGWAGTERSAVALRYDAEVDQRRGSSIFSADAHVSGFINFSDANAGELKRDVNAELKKLIGDRGAPLICRRINCALAERALQLANGNAASSR